MIYENRTTLAARALPLAANDGRFDLATLEILGELLERWSALEPEARVRLARSLIVRVTGSAPDPRATEAALREQLERLTR